MENRPHAAIFLSLAVFFLVLSACGKEENAQPSSVLPGPDTKVVIHADIQRAFLRDEPSNVNLYVRGVEELSRPLALTYSWESEEGPFTVTLSEHADYSEGFVYQSENAEVSFTNLKIGTPYYVKVENEAGTVKAETFETSDEIIRNMYVSGVTNVRDLGGYSTAEGVLKQGLIYRGGRLNQNDEQTVVNKITEKGIATMHDVIKLKSEIDLRLVENNEVGGLTEGVGVLGEGVKYYQCPMSYSGNMESDLNNASLKKVFEILGDKSNYPTYFHCSIGTDRTGYVAWLINAFLGVSEEHLYRDYLFSNFGNIGGKRNEGDIKDRYVATINSCEGESMQEKTTSYLLSHGITQGQLDVIREMMLGK